MTLRQSGYAFLGVVTAGFLVMGWDYLHKKRESNDDPKETIPDLTCQNSEEELIQPCERDSKINFPIIEDIDDSDFEQSS